jgi:hypothetical protein
MVIKIRRSVTVAWPMRHLLLSIVLAAFSTAAFPQNPESNDALLSKTRALYDAPFTRNLISFDCAVRFDWKQHFVDALGAVPRAATPVVERLQQIPHRVFVDRTGAVLSAIPKAPDLSNIPRGSELEKAFDAMVTGGLNGWLPFGKNEILPTKPTNFSFEGLGYGYRVILSGAGVDATLQLGSDFRLKSGVSRQPQSFRLATEFVQGPQGYLVQTVKTAPSDSPEGQNEATFSYTYQEMDGFQLPSSVEVTPAVKEAWKFELTDCKVNKGITLTVAPSPKIRSADPH